MALTDGYINLRKILDGTDVFLTYCKFLEGYDLRKSQDEKIANDLLEKLKIVLKNKELSTSLSLAFKEVGSEYKSKNVADWIATGFLGRIGLNQRIRKLDENFCKSISANSSRIIKSSNSLDFYNKISKTRNYYSHFKPDASGILELVEIYETLPVLEILIISILLFESGLEITEIHKIMSKDRNYSHLLYHLNPELQ